jgi:hypothetical protein
MLYAMFAIVRNSTGSFTLMARVLSALAGFELLTGALLAAFSPSISIASVCDNFALYMLLVVTVLGALYVRTSRAGSRFPVTQSISSIAGGMVPVIIAAALGL